MGFEGRCRVTGIGSLPFTDVAEGLDLVFELCPDLPYLVQLPRLSPLEGMNEQMYEGLPGLARRDGKWCIVQDEGFFLGVDDLFEQSENPDPDAGAISAERCAALGPFLDRVRRAGVAEAKAQVAGPVTLAMSLVNEEGTPALYDPILREIVTRHLALKVRWLAAQIQAAGARPLIFVDEPFLASFGTPFFAWTDPQQPRAVIEQVYAAAPARGTHCCSNTDWSIFLRSSVDVVSFDAFEFGENILTYRDDLVSFLRGGGSLAWGIVPTDPDDLARTCPAELTARLREMVAKLAGYGLDRAAVLRQSLITPACGLGSRPPEAARKAFETAVAISQTLRVEMA